MPNSLVVGASRGLGLQLAKVLHANGHQVFATVRSAENDTLPAEVKTIPEVDIGKEDAGARIVEGLKGSKLDLVIINAGVFKKEVGTAALQEFAPRRVNLVVGIGKSEL